MIGLICEPGYENNVNTKQQYEIIVSELRQRRIKYKIIENLHQACEFGENDETVIVVAIGNTKPWYRDIIKRCNIMGLRVINYSNYYPGKADGDFSCVLSDTHKAVVDIYKYFKAYGKDRVILYGVNPLSDFDTEIEIETQKVFGADDLKTIKKNDSKMFDEFFDVYKDYNGIVCTNDYDAIEIIQEIKRRDPDFLVNSFIISFSNTLLSLLYSPSITTFYESPVNNAKHIIKIYNMLMQNSDLNNVHLYINERLKIRETTHYFPFVQEKSFNVDKILKLNPNDDEPKEEKIAYNSEVVGELKRLEDLFLNFDKIDFNILSMLMQKKSTHEISEILYVSRGSVRYRIDRMVKTLGVTHREDMLELISKYITHKNLFRYPEEYMEGK